MIALQRGAGNRAVARLLQRQLATVANPLVGLIHGDGITFGTWDRRPRVTQLQQRLNSHMNADIATDGMFGDKTSQVLAEFQRSIRVPEQEPVDQVTADALLNNTPPGQATTGVSVADYLAIAVAASQLEMAGVSAGASGEHIQTASEAARGADALLASQLGTVAGWIKGAGHNLRMAGNAMGRLVGGDPTLGNQLVGLRHGDGLTFGTWERRDRVKVLQTCLNNHGALLAVDGMFGNKTSAALSTFQSTRALSNEEPVDADCADALIDAASGAVSSVHCDSASIVFGVAATVEPGVALGLSAAGSELRAQGVEPGLRSAAAAEQREGDAFKGVSDALAPVGTMRFAIAAEALALAAHLRGASYALDQASADLSIASATSQTSWLYYSAGEYAAVANLLADAAASFGG